MRILHTSDWHLGHLLKDHDRGPEHAAFLTWLVDRIREERPDALLLAGDVFDVANPAAAALRAWYQFLLNAHAAHPTMTVVVIAGNHDSGVRLDAPRELLREFRVHVVGAVPRRTDGGINAAAMLIPVFSPEGTLLARVAAVPYLRPSDLPSGEDPDRWVEAIRDVYAEVFAAAPEDDVPLLAMGHSYMVGGKVSELSERKILGGNLHALPDDIFPDRVVYAALGHLHLAQRVGKREFVRYSGSPIPLALDERGYAHQVSVVELNAAAPMSVRHLPIPRTVAVPRIPEIGSLALPEVLAALREFPAGTPAWIEVCVKVESRDTNVRELVEEAMAGKKARVLSVTMEGGASTSGLAELVSQTSLADLTPEEVFEQKWTHTWPDEPLPAELRVLFHELFEAAHQENV